MHIRHILLALIALVASPTTALSMPTERAPDRDYYFELPDGVRVAISIWLPVNRAAGARVPALLYQTRYGRQSPSSARNASMFPAPDYAIVFVDVRGTTASFGLRPREITGEADDMKPLVDHLASQDWSDGHVLAVGLSYLADTADVATAMGGEAVRGAIVRQSEFDVFAHVMQPGGVQNRWMLDAYDQWTLPMDTATRAIDGRAVNCALMREDCLRFAPTLTPVQGDVDLALARQAVSNRKRWRAADFASVTHRNQPSSSGYSFFDWSPARYVEQMRRRALPVQYWGSWMDAGTAEAALARFRSVPNAPMEVWITANDHHGKRLTDPLLPTRGEPMPTWSEQQSAISRFAARVLAEQPVERQIHYYALGSERMRTVRGWPPEGVVDHVLHLADGRRLVDPAPRKSKRAYPVDFTASSGTKTRWSAQLGVPAEYPDRRALYTRLASFDLAPLEHDTELAGHVLVNLRIETATPDPALHVYLDDVAPDGRVAYLTEGALRLIHRRISPRAALPYDQGRDRHSYSQRDAEPMPIGKPVDVEMALLPVAARIRAGHTLRLSIAGADADTFARYWSDHAESFVLHFGRAASTVRLPLRAWSDAEDLPESSARTAPRSSSRNLPASDGNPRLRKNAGRTARAGGQ